MMWERDREDLENLERPFRRADDWKVPRFHLREAIAVG
jgi:hypothetical protein